MNSVDDYRYEASRKELAAEILKQAGLDLRRFHNATSEVEREFYLDAYRWIVSDDCSWPFAFLSACQALNLAPETVRQEVLGDLSLGTFGYFSRRCARAARRFKICLSNIFANERTTNAADPVTSARALH
jgi:hypothetical protein